MRMPRILSVALLIAVVAVAAFGCGGVTGVPETDFQALQSQFDAAKQSLSEFQAQVDQLTQDLVDARAAQDKLEGQLANSGSGIDPAEHEALRQQYDDATARIDELTSQLADLTDAYNIARGQNASYVDQIADLQQQVDDLIASQPPPSLPLTEANVQSLIWDRINQERNAFGMASLQTGSHLVQWTGQHTEQMAAAQRTTTFTDAVVGVQAANMAVGYLSATELVDATFLFWKISPAWFNSIFLQPSISYGGVAVLQVGGVFYISFMGSNFP